MQGFIINLEVAQIVWLELWLKMFFLFLHFRIVLMSAEHNFFFKIAKVKDNWSITTKVISQV